MVPGEDVAVRGITLCWVPGCDETGGRAHPVFGYNGAPEPLGSFRFAQSHRPSQIGVPAARLQKFTLSHPLSGSLE